MAGPNPRLRADDASAFSDAGLVQIEWSEGEVLKLVGVGTEVEEGTARGCGSGNRWLETV
jgi:hypothetical protein